jgi:hypothetical protein
MDGVVHLDTLYLLVKYPHLDVFSKWYRHAEGVNYRVLRIGVPQGEFVVRNGASCYKVSVWQHDARAYLTDQVDDQIGEGMGSGIWVQLGPRFLIHNMEGLQIAVKEFLAAVGVKGEFPTKINRIDIALDLFEVRMTDQDINLWKKGWVGRSKVSDMHFNSRTGELETIYVGSRNSSIYLRIYNKVAQAEKEGDLSYWLDIWRGYEGPVTRIEWEIKPDQGHFDDDLKDFSIFNRLTIQKTLIYLLDWGRLCVPNPNDSNNRRWEDAKIWQRARRLAAEFCEGVHWPISRYGKEFHETSEGYVKFLSGTISGGMARFGLEGPNMVKLIEGLEQHGHDLETIQEIAKKKAAIYSRL